jgi:hypothetical protein
MVSFRVKCGDWIYPSRDSGSGVQYPIDKPLVAEILLSSEKRGERVSARSGILFHLNGPRFLELKLDEERSVLKIVSMGNAYEESFSKSIGFEYKFELGNLSRVRDLPDGTDPDRCAIFFTSVLLQAYLGKTALPTGISFRKATIPEIESLGKW